MGRMLEPRAYALLALLASAAMLAAAHAFERIGGYEPCLLCLRQREVYWIAAPVAALGFLMLRRRLPGSLRRAVPLLLALVFFVGFLTAGYHAGVEWKWWAGPETCALGGGVGLSGLEALAGGAKVRVVACDEAAWVTGGLSMAGWNALVSLALAGLGLFVAATARERRRG